MRRKTHEEFLADISDLPITALEDYAGSSTRIKFKCDIDGNEWYSKPNWILSGRGCPVCGNRNRSISHRKRNDVLWAVGGIVCIDVATPKYPQGTSEMNEDDFNNIAGRISLDKTGYPIFHNKEGSSFVHRHIMQCPDGMDVDHINRDPSDNRRSNLRICSHAHNQRNLSFRKDNTSGFTGVYWDEENNKWMASIRHKRQQIFLGRFSDIEDAKKARATAEKKYFGEYAPNHKINHENKYEFN